MGRSPGFGSTHTYYSPISDSLSLRLHIRCLTLHVCVTRRFRSERTSYLQVRLEFHPYPQLIRSFFNISRFGPPSSVTWTSTWSWVDHLVSGLHTHTTRPFQTRFRYGSTFAA